MTNGVLSPTSIRFILPPETVVVDGVAELTELNPNVLNFQRLLAYQFVYFHFYTNSSIDPVYSADLYRHYFSGLRHRIGSDFIESFFINGIRRDYDYFSGHFAAFASFFEF